MLLELPVRKDLLRCSCRACDVRCWGVGVLRRRSNCRWRKAQGRQGGAHEACGQKGHVNITCQPSHITPALSHTVELWSPNTLLVGVSPSSTLIELQPL